MRRRQHRDYNSAVGLVILTVLLSGLTWTGSLAETASDMLKVTREGVLRGQVWRLVTYAFVTPLSFWLIFKLLILLYIARPIELVWGTRRFLTLVAVSVIGGGLTSVAFDKSLSGGWALTATLMLIHGFMFPQTQIYLFFAIPVRVKTLAIVVTVFFLLDCAGQKLTGLAYGAGMFTGVLYYVLVTRSIPWVRWKKRRVMQTVTNPAFLTKKTSTGRIMKQVQEIVERSQAGAAITKKEQAIIEELIQRSDPMKELCPPQEFNPNDNVCPPCAELGLCLRRFLETADIEDEN